MTDEARAPHDAGARRKSVRFAGYAALFDQMDRGGDVVKRGAFIRSLTGAMSGASDKRIPLLYGHNPLKRVGEIELLAEDDKGLRVIAARSGRYRPDENEPGLSYDPAEKSPTNRVYSSGGIGLSPGSRTTSLKRSTTSGAL